VTSELDGFIRGPTHITRTDVWVSCGDTLSLFKRRGEKGIGLVVGGYGEAKSLDGIGVTLLEVLEVNNPPAFLTKSVVTTFIAAVAIAAHQVPSRRI